MRTRTGKKPLVLLLTLSMALSLTVTAAAAEEDGGVTILYTNDIHTYLHSFPVDATTGVPTIPADSQYADVNGDGRITIVHRPASYTDVAEGAWYAGAVSYVTANGLMAGATETAFAPNAPITAALNAVAPAEAETGGQSVTREALTALLWIRAGSPVSVHSFKMRW